MDAKTKAVLENLHTDVVEQKLDKAQWSVIMQSVLSKQQVGIVADDMRAGILALRDQDTVDMAISMYPWMANEFKAPDGTVYPAWIDRIRALGVTRPKDLVHLSKISFLVENKASLDFFL